MGTATRPSLSEYDEEQLVRVISWVISKSSVIAVNHSLRKSGIDPDGLHDLLNMAKSIRMAEFDFDPPSDYDVQAEISKIVCEGINEEKPPEKDSPPNRTKKERGRHTRAAIKAAKAAMQY